MIADMNSNSLYDAGGISAPGMAAMWTETSAPYVAPVSTTVRMQRRRHHRRIYYVAASLVMFLLLWSAK